MNRKRKQMSFAVSMIWRVQSDHHSDCYFGMTKLSEFSRKSKSKIVYLDYQSAFRPVPHGLKIPVLISPVKSDIENEETCESRVRSAESSAKEMYVANVDERNTTIAKSVGVI